MTKKINALLASALVFATVSSLSVSAANTSVHSSLKETSIEAEIMPLDLELTDGTVTDATDWEKSIKLNKENGKYVNFFIVNTGNVDITITINDSNARTFSPGESGHIYTEVTGIFAKTYTFKARPAHSGAISFQYYIAQRDNQ